MYVCTLFEKNKIYQNYKNKSLKYKNIKKTAHSRIPCLLEDRIGNANKGGSSVYIVGCVDGIRLRGVPPWCFVLWFNSWFIVSR